MRLGILYETKRHHSPNVNVAAALIEFNRAVHTQGHQPAEVRFNPAQRDPDLTEIAGLRVLSDRHVRPNHIRITTAPLSPPDELAADRAEFTRQVEAEAIAA